MEAEAEKAREKNSLKSIILICISGILILLGQSAFQFLLLRKVINENNKYHSELQGYLKEKEELHEERYYEALSLLEEYKTMTGEQINQSEERLLRAEAEQLWRAFRAIDTVDKRVMEIEMVYGELLRELKKQHPGLYNEETLLAIKAEARSLFAEGKYKQANNLFEQAAKEEGDNLETQFYRLYSLFLANRADSSQYSNIKEGLLNLQMRGYIRDEIKEILAYIAEEEKGRK
ncbi:MAG: hypothetical protein FWH35_00865 [Treponema sp.]|nr:hypothetical protein [Treponema sp.]